MAEVLIDRLTAAAPDRLPQAALPGIFSAFASAMDALARSPDADFGHSRAWLAAERAVTLLLRKATPEVRAGCLRALFAEGPSLGWLNSILRSEIFAHGRYGNRAQPEDQRLLTTAEFAAALETMFGRYRNAPPADLLAVPNLISLLYGWDQGTGTDEARRWVEARVTTDAGLLAFLSRARSWRATNDVVYYPLKQADLEKFLDYNNAVERVQRVAVSPDVPADQRTLAGELMDAFAQDRRDREE